MSTPTPNERRGFLGKMLALGGGAVALAVPGLTALAAFLNPWRQKAEAGKSICVGRLDALPVDKPQRVPVVADRSDAWNRYPAEPIGVVFLCRRADGQVLALQSICPHNGGCVSFNEKENAFWCPAHGALFDIEGRRTQPNSISPRDLDTLEVEVRNGNEVWVKYERFRDGIAEKIVKS
jgi:menaquinol-cytochrome c reductase iron-sulfur subunit